MNFVSGAFYIPLNAETWFETTGRKPAAFVSSPRLSVANAALDKELTQWQLTQQQLTQRNQSNRSDNAARVETA